MMKKENFLLETYMKLKRAVFFVSLTLSIHPTLWTMEKLSPQDMLLLATAGGDINKIPATYQCPNCFQAFKFAQNLEQHQAVHRDSNPQLQKFLALLSTQLVHQPTPLPQTAVSPSQISPLHEPEIEQGAEVLCEPQQKNPGSGLRNKKKHSLDTSLHLDIESSDPKQKKASLQKYHCNFPGCDYVAPKPYLITRHKKIHPDQQDTNTGYPTCHYNCGFKCINPKLLSEHVRRVHLKIGSLSIPTPDEELPSANLTTNFLEQKREKIETPTAMHKAAPLCEETPRAYQLEDAVYCQDQNVWHQETLYPQQENSFLPTEAYYDTVLGALQDDQNPPVYDDCYDSIPALKDLQYYSMLYDIQNEYPNEHPQGEPSSLPDAYTAQEPSSAPETCYAKEPFFEPEASSEEKLSSDLASKPETTSKEKPSCKKTSSSADDKKTEAENLTHRKRGRPKDDFTKFLPSDCPECGKTYATPYLLASHKLLHSKQKRGKHRCPYNDCGYSNDQSVNVRRHVEKVHVKVGQPAPKNYPFIQHKKSP